MGRPSQALDLLVARRSDPVALRQLTHSMSVKIILIISDMFRNYNGSFHEAAHNGDQ